MINKSKKNSKKNLIFLLPVFSQGGAGLSILKLCKSINYKNFNIYIISLGKNYYKKEFSDLNFSIIEVPFKRLILSIFYIKKIIKKIIKKNNMETFLVSNINYASAISCFFFRKINLLKIITIERTPIQELDFNLKINNFPKIYILKFLIKHFYVYAFKRIGNSSPVSKDLEKFCKNKVNTILPFIKITKKSYVKFRKKKISLVWIGRMTPEKNIGDLLNAINFLKNVDYRLNIVSDKTIELKKFDINKNQRKKINFIKFNKRSLNKIYVNSDILISTSYYEGFPNVIAEAINYNCLIISAKNFGGSNQLIKNGKYGVNYKLNNPKDLANKIIEITKKRKVMKKKIEKSKKNLISLSEIHNNAYKNLFERLERN